MIDASGAFEGKPYKNVLDLERMLHDSPSTTSCVAKRVFEYGTGRAMARGESELLKYLQLRFARDKYAFPALMKTVATSRAFQTVSGGSAAASN